MAALRLPAPAAISSRRHSSQTRETASRSLRLEDRTASAAAHVRGLELPSSSRAQRAGRIGPLTGPLTASSGAGERKRAPSGARAAAADGASSTSAKRPVIILPGLGNNTADYDSLRASLEGRGFPCAVAQVARADWLRNAAGLLDSNYWKGTLKPRPILDWYLQRIDGALQAAKEAAPSAPGVSVIAHSAGGWLARLFLAEYGAQDVSLLLTLGSPHMPPPRGIPGVVDQTRGLLYHIEDVCPGAFHAPDVRYVCVSGRYLKGSPLAGNSSEAASDTLAAAVGAAGSAVTPTEPASTLAAAINPQVSVAAGEASTNGTDGSSLRAKIVGQGYKQVCGRADVWGDGVVPEPSALLPGATHLILEGVYHSPVGATDERPWYGSEPILSKWVDYLHE